MSTMSENVAREYQELYEAYPKLEAVRGSVAAAHRVLADCFFAGSKLLVCGNGGSAADADHIVAELMKSFKIKRQTFCEPVSSLLTNDDFICEGLSVADVATQIQGALPAISLSSHTALMTAFCNDVQPVSALAQQVNGYGSEGDVLLAISTSGNSANILAAVYVAQAKRMKVIGLTGGTGGKLAELVDVSICVPANQTYRIQELHQPVYHAICAALEQEFFGDNLKQPL